MLSSPSALSARRSMTPERTPAAGCPPGIAGSSRSSAVVVGLSRARAPYQPDSPPPPGPLSIQGMISPNPRPSKQRQGQPGNSTPPGVAALVVQAVGACDPDTMNTEGGGGQAGGADYVPDHMDTQGFGGALPVCASPTGTGGSGGLAASAQHSSARAAGLGMEVGVSSSAAPGCAGIGGQSGGAGHMMNMEIDDKVSAWATNVFGDFRGGVERSIKLLRTPDKGSVTRLKQQREKMVPLKRRIGDLQYAIQRLTEAAEERTPEQEGQLIRFTAELNDAIKQWDNADRMVLGLIRGAVNMKDEQLEYEMARLIQRREDFISGLRSSVGNMLPKVLRENEPLRERVLGELSERCLMLAAAALDSVEKFIEVEYKQILDAIVKSDV